MKTDRGYILGCYSDSSEEARYLYDPAAVKGQWGTNPEYALIFKESREAENYRFQKLRSGKRKKRQQYFISKCFYRNKKTTKRRYSWSNPETVNRLTFISFTKINALQMLGALMKV